MTVSAYSLTPRRRIPRPFSFKDQVPEEVKEERSDEIMELQQEIAFEKSESMKGSVLEVMIEGKVADENAYVGRTYMDSARRGRADLCKHRTFPDVRRFLYGYESQAPLEYDLIGEVEDEFTE